LFAYEYAENLAEHGWIFLAPNHTGDTAIDRLTDAEIDRALSLALRPEDGEASLDWLENDANVVGLEGAADTSNAMMLGHSRGGTTALMLAGARLDIDALMAACEDDCDAYEDPEIVTALQSSRLDPRFTTIVAQAPASVLDFGEGELAAITAPVMLMTGDLDMTTPEAAMAWDLLDGDDDVWIRVPNGAHLTFLSICEDLDPVLDFLLPEAVTDGCGPDFVRPEDVVDVLRGYVLAYGERWVLGNEDWDDVLRPPPLDEEVEITLR
jgi:predicted dienelactone hydrolase